MYKGKQTFADIKKQYSDNKFNELVDDAVKAYGLSKYSGAVFGEKYTKQKLADYYGFTKGTLDSILKYAKQNGYNVRTQKIMQNERQEFLNDVKEYGAEKAAADWKITEGYAKRLMKNAETKNEKQVYSPVGETSTLLDSGINSNIPTYAIPPAEQPAGGMYNAAFGSQRGRLATRIASWVVGAALLGSSLFVNYKLYNKSEDLECRAKAYQKLYSDLVKHDINQDIAFKSEIESKKKLIHMLGKDNQSLEYELQKCRDTYKKHTAKKHKKPVAAYARQTPPKGETPPSSGTGGEGGQGGSGSGTGGGEETGKTPKVKEDEEKKCLEDLTFSQQLDKYVADKARQSFGYEGVVDYKTGQPDKQAKGYDENYNPNKFGDRLGRDFSDAGNNLNDAGKKLLSTGLRIPKFLSAGYIDKKENQPKGFFGRVGYMVKQVFGVPYDGVGAIKQTGCTIVNGGLEPILDSTIGNTKIGEKATRVTCNGLQAVEETVFDCTPGQANWNKVFTKTDMKNKGIMGAPILNNTGDCTQTPLQITVDIVTSVVVTGAIIATAAGAFGGDGGGNGGEAHYESIGGPDVGGN